MSKIVLIPDNEKRDGYNEIQKRWNNFFRNQYKKVCKDNEKFRLSIFDGVRLYIEEDFSLTHTVLEGEFFVVDDFHCSADFVLNPGVKEIIYKVKIWGKMEGVTVSESEKRTVYCHGYQLKINASDFVSNKKLVISWDKSKPASFASFDYSPEICRKQKDLALKNIVMKDAFDNFNKNFIFPIIRNSLVEYLLPNKDLKDEVEENPMALHPKFGTW